MNIIDILIPLYLLITLGFFLKKYQFPSNEFWPGMEKMIYFILFPILVFVAILKAPMDISLFGKLAILTLIPAVISALLQYVGFLSPSISRATFSSMFQGAVRNNTTISLIIVAWLVPDTGLAMIAVIVLIMVPFNNITSVLVLLRYGKNENPQNNSASLWMGVIKNPLIIASASGLVLNVFGLKLPDPLLNTADFLGRSALPFGLLAVGAGLKFGSFFDNKLAILLSSMGKLVVTPALTYALCIMLNIETDIAKVVIIFSAMPTAISSYILAKQMGGDADGMAQIITFQIIAAALTLPVILLIAQSY
ncbi:MAG: AEC family transporter [Cocleimonas sp.]|nr:AEC family transporter [Cocleimonas sp.]